MVICFTTEIRNQCPLLNTTQETQLLPTCSEQVELWHTQLHVVKLKRVGKGSENYNHINLQSILIFI